MSARDDLEYMDRALRLAERGRGRTSPNPMVGAIVVSRDGVVVGSGAHLQAGAPHAEVYALEEAGRLARGGTLYCTLEPCCHHGRTGPCTERIVEAGIQRVVAGVRDPNPLVNGRGLEYLQAHEVDVSVDIRREEAERLNAVFFTTVKLQRPYIIAKIAMSLDGRIAARPGTRTPITSPASLRRAHRLRAEVDAIGIGSGTLLADDPELTARIAYRSRPLTRVVFDRRLRTPTSARLFSTLSAGPIIIVTTPAAVRDQPERAEALNACGATLEIVDCPDFVSALDAVYRRGVTSLLLEGGADLHAAAWKAGVVDRVQMFIGPTILGEQGVPWLDPQVFSIAALRDCRVEQCGVDVCMDGYVHRTD